MRNQATVIAIAEASGKSEAVEMIAEPDQIVNLSTEEMTDSIVTIVCSSEEKMTSQYTI